MIHRGVEIVQLDVPSTPFVWIHDETDHHEEAESPEAARAQIDAYLDDFAVKRFAAAMRAKLTDKRAEGYGGWDDPAKCSVLHLRHLLRRAVRKGDPVDVGNFAMMLHQRGGRTHG